MYTDRRLFTFTVWLVLLVALVMLSVLLLTNTALAARPSAEVTTGWTSEVALNDNQIRARHNNSAVHGNVGGPQTNPGCGANPSQCST